MAAKIGARMGEERAFLLGRRSYEDLLAGWNAQGGPHKDALNAETKYVASSSSATTLGWPNSRLLHGDIPAAVDELKRTREGNLVMMGSGQLIRSLLPHDLIDEFLLMIHRLALGSGQRLFEDDNQVVKLRLVDSNATTTGVILATYQPGPVGMSRPAVAPGNDSAHPASVHARARRGASAQQAGIDSPRVRVSMERSHSGAGCRVRRRRGKTARQQAVS